MGDVHIYIYLSINHSDSFLCVHFCVGDIPINLLLKFLYGHNRTDMNILNTIKGKLDPRNSVMHNVAAMAHAIMQCGTTVDTFLASNMDWLR